MQTATMEDVQARLPQILDELAPGEEVVITRGGKPVARLTGPGEIEKACQIAWRAKGHGDLHGPGLRCAA